MGVINMPPSGKEFMDKKNNILMRKVKLSDFEQIFSLWEKAGLSLASKQIEFYDFQNILKLKSSSCFVLTDKQDIVGCILGTFNGRRGWIYHLAVHPSYQHLGLGSLLLNAVEKELKKKGAHKINLGVTFTNLKVIPFYEKSGFTIMTDALYLTKIL